MSNTGPIEPVDPRQAMFSPAASQPLYPAASMRSTNEVPLKLS
ncbi:MAG: hypothetical protein R3C99_21245 [Pirellulaceae bacterium]